MSTLVADGEINEKRIMQRAKQVQYGKNTPGYQHYIACVPKEQRDRYHPQTPRIHQKCSKRSWDGQLAKWRRELHKWDPHPRECPPREPKEKPARKERYQNRRQQPPVPPTTLATPDGENLFLERAMNHTPTQFTQTCGKSDALPYSGGGSLQSMDSCSSAFTTPNVYHAPGSQYHPSVAKPIVMPPTPHHSMPMPTAPQRVVPTRPTPVQMPPSAHQLQYSNSSSGQPTSSPSLQTTHMPYNPASTTPQTTTTNTTTNLTINTSFQQTTEKSSSPTTADTPNSVLSRTSSSSSFPGIYIKRKPKRPSTPSSIASSNTGDTVPASTAATATA